MLQRTVTGFLGLGALIAILYFRGWVASLVIVVFCVMGLFEEYNAFKAGGHRPCAWPGLLAAALLWPAYLWKGAIVLLPLTVFVMLLIMFEIVRRKKPEWIDAVASLYPVITVFLPMALFLILLDDSYHKYGLGLVVLAFTISFSGDIFAYFVGSLMGKHKLSPIISPNKTIEGSIAGLVGSVVMSVVLVFVGSKIGLALPGYSTVMLLGLIGGIAGQVGDLSASLVKRHCGIKDFGSIFPGHGGIMDRLDSVLFTLIVICSYCIMIA